MTSERTDNEREHQLLYQGLKRASGFQLYLVECNSNRLRSQILDSLTEQLGAVGITVHYHHLKKPVTSLNDFLPPGFHTREKGSVIMVSGLENSFSTTGSPQFFLHRLNYARDVLPKKIPVPLVLWLPVGAFTTIITEAHDLWSWRAGTYHFSSPQETTQNRSREIPVQSETGYRIQEFSAKSYKERLHLFSGFWKDLTRQPDSPGNRRLTADVLQQIGSLHYSHAVINLAHTKTRGEYLEKALEFQEKAVKIYESELDKNEPSLAFSYENLSLIYRALDQADRALEFQQKAVDIMQRLFPDGHPTLDNMKRNLESLKKR